MWLLLTNFFPFLLCLWIGYSLFVSSHLSQIFTKANRGFSGMQDRRLVLIKNPPELRSFYLVSYSIGLVSPCNSIVCIDAVSSYSAQKCDGWFIYSCCFLLWYITFLHVLCHDMPLHISKTVKFLTTWPAFEILWKIIFVILVLSGIQILSSLFYRASVLLKSLLHNSIIYNTLGEQWLT